MLKLEERFAIRDYARMNDKEQWARDQLILLQEIDERDREIERLTAALRQYENPENWSPNELNYAVIWDGDECGDDGIIRHSGPELARRALKGEADDE